MEKIQQKIRFEELCSSENYATNKPHEYQYFIIPKS